MTKELREKFKAFDKANPEIYIEFRALANKLRLKGRRRYGAWAIMNVLRWNRDIETDGDYFKIRNDFIALYSRKLAREDKFWFTFFGLKALKRN